MRRIIKQTYRQTDNSRVISEQIEHIKQVSKGVIGGLHMDLRGQPLVEILTMNTGTMPIN